MGRGRTQEGKCHHPSSLSPSPLSLLSCSPLPSLSLFSPPSLPCFPSLPFPSSSPLSLSPLPLPLSSLLFSLPLSFFLSSPSIPLSHTHTFSPFSRPSLLLPPPPPPLPPIIVEVSMYGRHETRHGDRGWVIGSGIQQLAADVFLR